MRGAPHWGSDTSRARELGPPLGSTRLGGGCPLKPYPPGSSAELLKENVLIRARPATNSIKVFLRTVRKYRLSPGLQQLSAEEQGEVWTQ